MSNWRVCRWLVVGFFVCAGLIGLVATDAFAVAGKMTGVPPGAAALAGGSVTVVLDEPVNGLTKFTSTVGPNGEVNFPQGVDPNRGGDCRYTDEKGNTAAFRCGGFFVMGSGPAAATMASAAAATGATAYSFLGSTELIVGGGYVTGIGATGGNARSNFADTSGKGDHLSGGSLSILVRSFVPYQPFGIKLGGFLEYDEFFSLDGSSGVGVQHLNPDANDTKTIRKVNRAFGIGFTQVFPIGSGFFIDLQQGIAFVRQSVEGVTDQSSGGGPTERFKKEFTSIAPKLGASLEYQFPNMPFRVRLASEFIYLPSAGISGFATFSGSPFVFSSRGQWMATNTFGLVIPLNVFERLLM